MHNCTFVSEHLGQRALVGKVNMDRGSCIYYSEDALSSLEDTKKLALIYRLHNVTFFWFQVYFVCEEIKRKFLNVFVPVHICINWYRVLYKSKLSVILGLYHEVNTLSHMQYNIYS